MKHTFEAGKYFVGDPCYALSDEVYDEWGTKKFSSGEIVTSQGVFFVHGTMYGDGMYFDDEETKYPVDSGTLALIPWILCEKLKHRSKIPGRILTFREDGEFAAKHGIFRILADIDVCIDTRGIISNDDDIDFE